MMRSYRSSSGDDAIASLIALTVVAAVVLAVFAAMLLAGLAKEIFIIYKDQGAPGKPYARVLWGTAVALGTGILLCGLVAAIVPAATPLCVYLIAWGFLVAVVIVEACAWYGGREERRELSGNLDDYLNFGGTSTMPSSVRPQVEVA